MHTRLPGFSSLKDQDTLWRYMSFEKFVNLLATQSLYFARSDTFEDKFEGFLPPLIQQEYERITDRLGKEKRQAIMELWDNWRKWVMCCCWHRGDQETMGMWEKYSMHKGGIAIKTTMQRLRGSFEREEDVPVYIANVRYINHYEFKVPKSIRDMNTIYLPFFYKGKAFKYENEVRAIIDTSHYIKEDFFRVKKVPDINPKVIDLQQLLRVEYPKIDEIGRKVRVDLKTLIGEVIISPYADDWITKTVKLVVDRYGFDFPVNPSKLLDPPVEVDETTEHSKLERNFWTELRDYMHQEGIQLQARQPGTGRFQVFEIGRRTFCLEAWIYKRDPEHGLPQIGVRLRMSGRDGPAHFHLLKRQSEEIVKELGETPKWREYPSHRNLNIVYLDKSNVDVTDETDWPNQHAWLASKLEKFNEVFQPRIMTLNAADWEPPEDEDEA